jgi:hypothetical protein
MTVKFSQHFCIPLAKYIFHVFIMTSHFMGSIVKSACKSGAINCKGSNILTCQPIIGLRNKVLLGGRLLNASRPNTLCAAVGEAVFAPCRAVLSRTAPSAGTQQAAMTSHGSTLVSKATLVNTVTRQQCRSYDWGFIRGTEISKQSVLRSSPTSEVLIGDRHRKCDDAKCVIIWNSDW